MLGDVGLAPFVPSAYLYGFFALLGSMSVYLARDIAFDKANLARKLVEVGELSERQRQAMERAAILVAGQLADQAAAHRELWAGLVIRHISAKQRPEQARLSQTDPWPRRFGAIQKRSEQLRSRGRICLGSDTGRQDGRARRRWYLLRRISMDRQPGADDPCATRRRP